MLSEPGTADVSCSVDFRSLRRAALALAVPETGSGTTKPVVVHGPLTQGELLMGLGIEVSNQLRQPDPCWLVLGFRLDGGSVAAAGAAIPTGLSSRWREY